jgi:hypothetical protein
MVRIEVDAATARKIEQASEPIELYDDRGRQIGFFSRPISSEEVAEARRRSEMPSDGSSLDEVWKRIKSQSEPE